MSSAFEMNVGPIQILLFPECKGSLDLSLPRHCWFSDNGTGAEAPAHLSASAARLVFSKSKVLSCVGHLDLRKAKMARTGLSSEEQLQFLQGTPFVSQHRWQLTVICNPVPGRWCHLWIPGLPVVHIYTYRQSSGPYNMKKISIP